MLTGKRVGIKLLYNPGDRKFKSVGEKMLEWGTCPREAGPPGPRLSSPGERERNAVMAIRVGVNMLQSLFSLQLPLTHNPFNKGVRLSSLRCYAFACIYVYMYYVAIQHHGAVNSLIITCFMELVWNSIVAIIWLRIFICLIAAVVCLGLRRVGRILIFVVKLLLLIGFDKIVVFLMGLKMLVWMAIVTVSVTIPST